MEGPCISDNKRHASWRPIAIVVTITAIGPLIGWALLSVTLGLDQLVTRRPSAMGFSVLFSGLIVYIYLFAGPFAFAGGLLLVVADRLAPRHWRRSVVAALLGAFIGFLFYVFAGPIMGRGFIQGVIEPTLAAMAAVLCLWIVRRWTYWA